MLYETIDNAYQLYDRFRAFGRENQFSLEALEVILEVFEEEGEDVELDVIGICCDFTEEDAETIAEENEMEDVYIDGIIDADEVAKQLEDCTMCWVLDNGNILYLNY